MILSSRCGRGRFARRLNRCRARFLSEVANLVFAFTEMLGGLGDAMPFDQDILAAELALRIAARRRVAVRLHAIMEN